MFNCGLKSTRIRRSFSAADHVALMAAALSRISLGLGSIPSRYPHPSTSLLMANSLGFGAFFNSSILRQGGCCHASIPGSQTALWLPVRHNVRILNLVASLPLRLALSAVLSIGPVDEVLRSQQNPLACHVLVSNRIQARAPDDVTFALQSLHGCEEYLVGGMAT